jgi:hypothetical protein
MRVFIGLDVSLAKTTICVVDHDGAVQWQGKVSSEPGPCRLSLHAVRLAQFDGVRRQRRAHPGAPQGQIAQKAGVSRSTVWRIERGRPSAGAATVG